MPDFQSPISNLQSPVSAYPIVYTVLVQWRTCNDTLACLESLVGTGYPNLRVVLVDNGTPPECQQAIAARFPEVEIINNRRNLGFAAANNIGIRHALAHGADFVLILNNDTTVHPHMVQALLAALQADETLGMVGPKILTTEPPNQLWYAGAKRTWLYGRPLLLDHRGFGDTDHGQYDQPQAVDFLSGCAMLVRRDVFEHVGLFDERYFAYFEDADLCLRARRAGFGLHYLPEARLWHHAASSSTGPENYRAYGVYFATRNPLLLMRTHGQPL
ncbi:MAG: glycosyltransferase family 2 protein, partial [Chloroflexaceae bacterium]|nr:glycosyltransferase family 2 protein [Chloroflexaceae bacterium]